MGRLQDEGLGALWELCADSGKRPHPTFGGSAGVVGEICRILALQMKSSSSSEASWDGMPTSGRAHLLVGLTYVRDQGMSRSSWQVDFEWWV